MNIRQLNVQDAADYKNIRLEMLAEHPEAFGGSVEESERFDLDFFENYISNNYIVGAFDGNNIIGSMGVYLNKNKKTKHCASMFGVYIQPNYRGRNILKIMIEENIRILPDYVEQIKSSVTYVNQSAVNAYKKIGFENIGLDKKALKVGNKYYDIMLIVKFLEK